MSNAVKTNKRILALDILRGVTIAGMIMVNNPGTWAHIYAPLRHAEWNGLTPTDLVFPFFMFIMGISTYISLKKYNFEFSHAVGIKILKRTILIFLIGMAIGWFSKFCYYWTSPTGGISFGIRMDVRPYPYSGCHATSGSLLWRYRYHCPDHEAQKHPVSYRHSSDRIFHPIAMWQWICL